MRILGLKPGHDGSVSVVDNGKLLVSIEGEKDNYPRYEPIHPEVIINVLGTIDGAPDVIALSGWHRSLWGSQFESGSGYFGHSSEASKVESSSFLGRPVKIYSSSHERSHLLCSYGLSPLPQGEPVYALVWEGHIGAFYSIDENVQIRKLGDVLSEVGIKYLFLYHLGKLSNEIDFGAAGKLMALAAFGEDTPQTNDEQKFIDSLLNHQGLELGDTSTFSWSALYKSGLDSQRFRNIAKKFSDAVFDTYYRFAKDTLSHKRPLLIAGGCGLNCDWNTKWRNSGLFTDLFVPPCTNDSGSSIGTSIDAQYKFTGNAKLEWDVFAGQNFVLDCAPPPNYRPLRFDHALIARDIFEGRIIGWVQGKYELGPRALGHRSILASPLTDTSRDRVNQIKQREDYRPVAPICLESDVGKHFRWTGPSEYMLYFQEVLNPELRAITHVDKTARVQTVSETSREDRLIALLRAFGEISNATVLCNTSLNFKGRGFINRMSDLIEFSETQGLDGFVVENKYFRKSSNDKSKMSQL